MANVAGIAPAYGSALRTAGAFPQYGNWQGKGRSLRYFLSKDTVSEGRTLPAGTWETNYAGQANYDVVLFYLQDFPSIDRDTGKAGQVSPGQAGYIDPAGGPPPAPPAGYGAGTQVPLAQPYTPAVGGPRTGPAGATWPTSFGPLYWISPALAVWQAFIPPGALGRQVMIQGPGGMILGQVFQFGQQTALWVADANALQNNPGLLAGLAPPPQPATRSP